MRGMSIHNAASAGNVSAQPYLNDDCRIIGYEWPGESAGSVKAGVISATQYPSYPDPREDWKSWMHLCFDPRAAKYLEKTMLANRDLSAEYQYYIKSGEFKFAGGKHGQPHTYYLSGSVDYGDRPKYTGSIYDHWTPPMPPIDSLYFKAVNGDATIRFSSE